MTTANANRSLCALLLLGLATTACAQPKVNPDEARAIAKDAYIFNYPLVMMYRTMYLQSIDTGDARCADGS